MQKIKYWWRKYLMSHNHIRGIRASAQEILEPYIFMATNFGKVVNKTDALAAMEAYRNQGDQDELWEEINEIKEDVSPYAALEHIKSKFIICKREQ